MLPLVALFALRSVKRSLKSAPRIALPSLVLALLLVIGSTEAFCQGALGSNLDGPAELPRVYIQSALADTPAPGHTIHTGAAGDLQDALDNASCGDTVELRAGATFDGPFRFPEKPCDDQHWIIIRTDAPDSVLPPEGTRITPCYAGVATLPGRPDFKCGRTQNVLARLISGANADVIFLPGANHYRFVGLEITRAVGGGAALALVTAEEHGTADHIIFDRVWVHGTAQDDTRRGIALRDTSFVAVVDSFFTDFHCTSAVGACTDAQTISGSGSDNPNGPYKIENNFLEAAGEGILFGSNPGSMNPSDIAIQRNHFFKPWQWMPGSPGFVGGPGGHAFVVKNHFELKDAQRVLFEGNILENNWGGFSQTGFSIVLTPRNTKEDQCPGCQVSDVTIRYNTISHVGAGIALATPLNGKGGGPAAQAGARYSIHDITVDDIDVKHYNGTGTLVKLVNAWSANPLNSVSVVHITGFPDVESGHLMTLLDEVQNPQMWGITFTNNIVAVPRYPVWSAGGLNNCAKTTVPVKNLAACFRDNRFADNVLIGSTSAYPPSSWPAGNVFVPGVAAVQFTNYKNNGGGDYQLLPSSPFKNEGTDGKDLGADINAIHTYTAGVY